MFLLTTEFIIVCGVQKTPRDGVRTVVSLVDCAKDGHRDVFVLPDHHDANSRKFVLFSLRFRTILDHDVLQRQNTFVVSLCQKISISQNSDSTKTDL